MHTIDCNSQLCLARNHLAAGAEAMSTHWSGSPSPATAASAASEEDTSSHWAPHGPVLTACVVGLNALVILLIVFFFWRFFSGKRGPSASAGSAADDDASSSGSLPVASPWASRRAHHAPAPRPLNDVASSLPVYMYTGDGGGKAAECAVCIVEIRDGDAARQLPRCGHRFHADCVGAWLRLHATCPLCRASVVAAAAAETRSAKDVVVGADCPV